MSSDMVLTTVADKSDGKGMSLNEARRSRYGGGGFQGKGHVIHAGTRTGGRLGRKGIEKANQSLPQDPKKGTSENPNPICRDIRRTNRYPN